MARLISSVWFCLYFGMAEETCWWGVFARKYGFLSYRCKYTTFQRNSNYHNLTKFYHNLTIVRKWPNFACFECILYRNFRSSVPKFSLTQAILSISVPISVFFYIFFHYAHHSDTISTAVRKTPYSAPQESAYNTVLPIWLRRFILKRQSAHTNKTGAQAQLPRFFPRTPRLFFQPP